MIEFNHKEVAESLRSIPARVRPIFSALIAERLYPSAEGFFRREDPGVLEAVEGAMGLLWQYGYDGTVDEDVLQQAVDACMGAIQHAEEADADAAPFASDAVAAITYGLRAIQNGDPQDCAWAAQRAYDSVFLFVENQSAEGSSVAEIDAHPIVQQELGRQANDIVTLGKLESAVDAKLIDDLRDAAHRDARSVFSS